MLKRKQNWAFNIVQTVICSTNWKLLLYGYPDQITATADVKADMEAATNGSFNMW